MIFHDFPNESLGTSYKLDALKWGENILDNGQIIGLLYGDYTIGNTATFQTT